jgi:hypothetical protein
MCLTVIAIGTELATGGIWTNFKARAQAQDHANMYVCMYVCIFKILVSLILRVAGRHDAQALLSKSLLQVCSLHVLTYAAMCEVDGTCIL